MNSPTTLFYTPEITGSTWTLNEHESKHCSRVLRLKEGDPISLTDGRGCFYHGIIRDGSAKACSVEIIKKEESERHRNILIHLAVAPTKNISRYEWFLEKACEIGIDIITPIICEHSERKNLNNERLNRVLIAAMKQSLKAWLPELRPSEKLKDFISKSSENEKYIALGEKGLPHIKELFSGKNDILMLIGPEGDFHPDEIALAKQNNYQLASLGPHRLRTETAALVACHSINMLIQ